ncbi:MAG: hypothetical protein ACHQRM_00545 [Bacteroidia bacterium]
MLNIDSFTTIAFIFTVLLTLAFFYTATGKNKAVFFVLLSWMVIQGSVALTGFYTVTNTTPPRFALLIAPPMLVIVLLFLLPKGRLLLDKLNTKTLTLMHLVRIPVELVLFGLFLQGAVPKLMTFEGGNLDILSGVTAPLVFYFGFIRNKLNKTVLIIWNLLCLALLFNIVFRAVLSAPFPFQKLAFPTPDIALLYFPFIWLPCLIVPLVLLAHLVCIRQLVRSSVNQFYQKDN